MNKTINAGIYNLKLFKIVMNDYSKYFNKLEDHSNMNSTIQDTRDFGYSRSMRKAMSENARELTYKSFKETTEVLNNLLINYDFISHSINVKTFQWLFNDKNNEAFLNYVKLNNFKDYKKVLEKSKEVNNHE